jgi:hypothetical protein
MDDYLSAIDDSQSYVDKERLGVLGQVMVVIQPFYLAGIHNKRFKTFIAHDGVFNTQVCFGTTEEVFFTNWDFEVHWEKRQWMPKKPTPHSSTLVEKWDTQY